MSDSFGATSLPPHVERALKKGRMLEWATLTWLVITVTLVIIVMGSSQAMKAAWMEDMLSFLPPIAFLLALRAARKEPDEEHRYGHHRAIGAGHLAASVALLGMGAFLVLDSGMTLIKREHPTIGTVQLFGTTIWQGWLMIAVMVVTSIPTVVLGRMKLGVSKDLHDKILFADADMNKADWQTAIGAILGIIGIGFGLWWADSVVAILIAASIIRDGVSNLGSALTGLMDRQARTHDDKEDLPLIGAVEQYFRSTDWAADSWVRMRDEGHVMHTEAFVIPKGEVSLARLTQARDDLRALDWKLHDTVVIPVEAFPRGEAED